MYIETKRLIIRNFESDDWQAVYTYTSNPSVMKFIPEGVLFEKDTKKFVTEQYRRKS